MKSVLIVIAICLGFVGLYVVGTALRVALLPVRVVDRSIGTLEGITDKTLTADNAIYNYRWFIQQREDIKGVEAKIEAAQASYDAFISSAGPRTEWSFEDKIESARLASVKQGLQSQYRDLVADYNARSKQADRAIFNDGKIPQLLEMGASFLK